jgi:hypothetical protein
MAQTQSPTLSTDTLDFIWQLTKDATEVQLKDVESLDSKAFQIISVASVVIGLTSLAALKTPITGTPGAYLIVTAVAYAICGLFSLGSLQIRKYRRSLYADELWPKHWMDTPDDIKHAMVQDISEAYAHNGRMLRHKSTYLRWALAALITESAFVAAAIISSVGV